MFEALSEFKRIIVTGPQRSGTNAAAHMIAHDTGFRFIDSIPGNGREWTWHLERLQQMSGVVKHAPFLARYIHNFADDDTMLVFMRRDLDAILRSQGRIGWKDPKELRRYPGATLETIAARKYSWWESHSRPRCVWYWDLPYEDLARHPLWVPPEQRINFRPRQWRG